MSNNSELIIYSTEDGRVKIDVKFENDTVWLSLEQMAALFQRDKSSISRHIKHIFEEGELSRESTVANFATLQTEGLRSHRRAYIPFFLRNRSFVGKECANGGELVTGVVKA